MKKDVKKKYKKTFLACCLSFITQAICANFLPLLFIMFHEDYGISFSRLALIPTVFFLTQLLIDFICAKAADRIDYRPCIIASAIACGCGLGLLAVLPGFAGILFCVILYAVGSGLIEVLASPMVEACPFDNKESVMSLLHSFYCWGSLGVILLSTLFFAVFGLHRWKILALIWAAVPLYNVCNFAVCPIEKLVDEGEGMSMGQLLKSGYFWVFIALMVCAGASEIAMAQWASAFAESALHVSKTAGDLAGPCGFAVCMGISRALYGKYGDKADLTVFMIFSGILCLICYLLAGFAGIPLMGLIGCAVCGFSVGIMWPGTISISSKAFKKSGTAKFALLALAGDLGGAIGPSIVGNVSQMAGNNLQAGVLSGIGFPIGLILCVSFVRRKNEQR